MKGRFTFYFFIAALLGFQMTCAQDAGFMYGKVTTIEDDTYAGAIRWGKEEVYWTDMFNAAKERNTNLDLLSEQERVSLQESYYESRKDNQWISVNWTGEWGDGDADFIHQFVCQFGELKQLVPYRRNGVEVTMQNGQQFEVSGEGYNDIGTKVTVYDPELGRVELNWSRIAKVEFEATPDKLPGRFGDPLYGTVTSRAGTFTGFIQWDHDERVGTDLLDGDNEDGDLSIAFENITSIERYGLSRSKVRLKSDRELILRGSNDVNDENRGIIVTIAGLGRVDIPWDEFEKVTFSKAKNSGPAYKDFSKQKKNYGFVTLKNGDSQSGEIVFDLDEAYNFEVVQGMLDDVEYLIPFRNIKKITPKNYDYSTITLTNGDEYLLGKSQDVSDRNQGVLVLQEGQSKYIEYAGIEMIEFR